MAEKEKNDATKTQRQRFKKRNNSWRRRRCRCRCRPRLRRDIEAEIAGVAAGVDAAVSGQRPKNAGQHLRKA